mmetsp:Transcript_73753/g.210322  ORF Transcript_73753/g.210322 Transcript_73753/m.210322 type:complete len:538 (+) Transcript_73753:91-1704(+)
MAAMEDPRKSVNGLPPPISTVSSPLCLPVGSNPTGAMLSGDIKNGAGKKAPGLVPRWVMPDAQDTIQPLKPVVKDYAWGIRGPDSRVARFALESGSISEIDPSAPYAELWLGTHPAGPTMLEDGRTLEEAVGEPLPFLFKVLSAGKALSIQAHPDKLMAQKLHQDNPEKYKDATHKPELAIALTPFEAMCGFRRIEEISVFLRKHPEFAACVSPDAKLQVFMAQDEETERFALRELFSSFMHCDPAISTEQLSIMLDRLRQEATAAYRHPHDEPPWERKAARAILRLAQQFPGDPGAMAPLFLNYLLIAPGESFFMAANEPHAYVAGEIIECMAQSDNVVRAGLTGKFKDVDNLVNMLSYTMGGPYIDAGAPSPTEAILRYTPPVPEFEVMIITVQPGERLTLPDLEVPAIFTTIEGAGFATTSNQEQSSNGEDTSQYSKLNQGRSFYLPPSAPPLRLMVGLSQRGPMKIALAHKNLHLDKPTSPLSGMHHESEVMSQSPYNISTRSPTHSGDEYINTVVSSDDLTQLNAKLQKQAF